MICRVVEFERFDWLKRIVEKQLKPPLSTLPTLDFVVEVLQKYVRTKDYNFYTFQKQPKGGGVVLGGGFWFLFENYYF